MLLSGIIFILLSRRLSKSSIRDPECIGHCNRKCSTVSGDLFPHKQKGSRVSLKLCWNLCARKWLKPTRSPTRRKTIPYNLRAHSILTLPSTERKTYGTYAIIFRASLIWNNLPSHIKKASNLIEFQARIKMWNGEKCGCRLCQIY